MNLNKKLTKINTEIQQELNMKAVNRLKNLINQYPNNLIIRERLAKLYYESGCLNAAGKFWILSEPKNEVIQKCITQYETSVNYSGTQILKEIIFKGDKEKLPDYAKNKLAELEKSSNEKSGYIPKFLPKKNQRKNQPKTLSEKIIPLILFSTLVLTLVLSLIVFFIVFGWVLRKFIMLL